ncbi:MAG: HEAT repeat domain-containing protein [Planctomycetota bacterium]|nr:HEAT repeat domain-containing protein [Planctomycetota bacterium]
MTRAFLICLAALLVGCGGDEQNKPKPSEDGSHTAVVSQAKDLPVFTLPADLEALSETAAVKITGISRSQLRLKALDAKKEARVVVPAGTILKPVAETKGIPSYVVREEAGLMVKPAKGSQSCILEVVNSDAAVWNRGIPPDEKDEFCFSTVPVPAELLSFFKLALERKMSWAEVQVGAWGILNDISAKEFSGNTVGTNTYNLDTGRFMETALTNYRGIMETRHLFEELGLDPMKYRLFQDKRRYFEGALKGMDFDKPGINWEAGIVNGRLEEFAGEPEAEDMLIQYATRHARIDIRERATRSLIDIGLLGDTNDFFETMLETEYRELRFLAALMLVKNKDMRGQPLLALYADDPFFGKCVSGLRKTLEKETDATAGEGETTLEFWERAAGWDALAKTHGDVTALRQLVDKEKTKSDPWLDELLRRLATGEGKEARSAISAIEKRYHDDRQAFDGLREAAMSHKDRDIRLDAAKAIIEKFGALDVEGVVRAVLEDEKQDPYVVKSAIRHAVVFGRFEGREKLLLDAARHSNAEVRAGIVPVLEEGREKLTVEEFESAICSLGERDPDSRVRNEVVRLLSRNKKLLPQEKAVAILLPVARTEPEKRMRDLALSALCELKAREVIPVLKEMIESGNKDQKNTAVAYLAKWKGDEEALGILERFRADPDIGKYVENHLKREGR